MGLFSEFKIKHGVLIKYRGMGGDVRIPAGVTAIGESAFYWCMKLTSVTIPDSLKSISAYAFKGCSSLKEVTRLAKEGFYELPLKVTILTSLLFTIALCSRFTVNW